MEKPTAEQVQALDKILSRSFKRKMLWENFLLAPPVRKRMTRRGWLDVSRAMGLYREALRTFRTRAAGPEALASSLSGGNRERLEVARTLTQNPRVIKLTLWREDWILSQLLTCIGPCSNLRPTAGRCSSYLAISMSCWRLRAGSLRSAWEKFIPRSAGSFARKAGLVD